MELRYRNYNPQYKPVRKGTTMNTFVTRIVLFILICLSCVTPVVGQSTSMKFRYVTLYENGQAQIVTIDATHLATRH